MVKNMWYGWLSMARGDGWAIENIIGRCGGGRGIFRRDVRGVIRVVGGGGVSRGGEWCLDS